MNPEELNLQYFNKNEFTRNGVEWFDRMNPILLTKLDILRSIWGAPIRISKNPDAVGRMDDTSSDHNFNKWKEVRAVDVFPEFAPEQVSKVLRGVRIPDLFFEVAKQVMFEGIGWYPDWEQGNLKGGFHLGVRYGKAPGQWAYVNGKMIPMELRQKTRKEEIVYKRYKFVKELLKEGYKVTEIAYMLDMDHSDISRYKNHYKPPKKFTQ